MLLIAPYYLPSSYGGAVQLYHQLLTRLQSFDALVLTQRQDRGDVAALESFDRRCGQEFGYEMRRLKRFEFKYSRSCSPLLCLRDAARFFIHTAREWRATLNEVRPDLIVCGATYIAGWLMNRTPGRTPLINYLHGEELQAASESRFLRPWLSRQQMQSIRGALMNIAVSRHTAGQAIKLAGVPADRVAVLPNFVDTERFKPPRNRDALRAQLGWQGKRVILSLARLTARKGIDQAIRAIAELRRHDQLPPEWLYVIAGTGEQERNLKELVGRLELNDCTRFVGLLGDELRADYYGAADIFLQPNRNISGDTEGFGIVFIEAAACGTPVIGGVAGGTADAIRDGLTGFRVDGDDVTSIASAIGAMVHDAALRSTMGRAGTEIVQREFRVEPAVRKFETLLLTVLEQHAAPT